MLEFFSERLRVDIAAPGTVYRGCRFDWSGFVTQVTLDGRHTFCVPESLVAGDGTGGIGLCNEFSPGPPQGFEGTAPGEWFPKIGIGLLQRPDAEPHLFGREYRVEPYPLSLELERDKAVFEFEPVLCQGYAVRLKKTLRVYGTRLRVEYELWNVGTRRIRTTEYNHNFLAINGIGAGPELELRLNPNLKLTQVSGPVEQQGTFVHWREAPAKPFMARTKDRPRYAPEEPVWRLEHPKSGVGVSETVSAPLAQFGLWFAPHAVSPEAIIEIDAKPGQMVEWWREWDFSSDK